MAEYLPPVVAKLQADIADFVAKIETAKSLLRDLDSNHNVNILVSDQGLARAATAEEGLRAATDAATEATREQEIVTATAAVAEDALREAVEATAENEAELAAAAKLASGALDTTTAAEARLAGASEAAQGAIATQSRATRGKAEDTAALSPELDRAASGEKTLSVAAQIASDALGEQGKKTRDKAADTAALTAEIERLMTAEGGLGMTAEEVTGLLDKQGSTTRTKAERLAELAAEAAKAKDSEDEVSDSSKKAADNARKAADELNAANQANRRFFSGGWLSIAQKDISLWAGALGDVHMIGTTNLLHIALDGAMETAIALTTSLIDLTGAFVGMAPAAMDIYTRMRAIGDVQGSLGRGIGETQTHFQELSSELAGPTMTAFGGILNLFKGNNSAEAYFYGTATALDTFIAKLDLWKEAQGQTDSVLKTGQQFLGDFSTMVTAAGRAFDAFLKADPGTAKTLFGGLASVMNGFADALNALPSGLLRAVMGIHSFLLWGGLLYSWAGRMLGRLPLVGNAIARAMTNPAVALAAAAIAYVALNWDNAANSIKTYINNQNTALNNMDASQAFAALPQQIDNVQKKLADFYGSSNMKAMQDELKQWSSMGQTAGSFGHALTSDLSGLVHGSLPSELKSFGKTITLLLGMGQGQINSSYMEASFSKLQTQLGKLLGSYKNMATEAGALVKSGDSVGQAFAVMDLAGVKFSDSLPVMQQKVKNLIAAYQQLGLQGTLMNNSMAAVTFSSELQQSQISTVTGAWTTFFQTLTGGQSGFDTFQQGLLTTKSDAGQAGASLNGLNKNSLQFQSDMTSNIQNASSFINSLLTMSAAGAQGAKGQKEITRATSDMVQEMIPAAKGNQQYMTFLRALATQGGMTSKQFDNLAKGIGGVKNPAKDLQTQMLSLTGPMSSVQRDSQNLSKALDPDVTGAIDAAIVSASNLGPATKKLFTDFDTGGTKTKQFSTDIVGFGRSLITSMGSASAAHAEFDAVCKIMGIGQTQADKLWKIVSQGPNTGPAKAKVQQIQTAIDSLHNKSVTVTAYFRTAGNLAAYNSLTSGQKSARWQSVLGGGYASGTPGASKGWAWVGEAGPELVKFSGGERVVPNHVATGYAGGTGVDVGGDIHTHVHLDGKEIYHGVQKQAVSAQRRTGTNGLAKRTR